MKNIKTDYLSIFEHICTIPHGSGNTEKIAEFCRDFAIYYGCDAKIDTIGNVIIKCKASDGFENRPTVILQGHTDMVCEKTLDSNHDFTKDPLKLIYDGGYLRADGTTLGGDDGIAVAYALSIIANKEIKHPPLEILLTADEETGLYGAEALDGNELDGRLMINIDSEEEGVLLSGCAGGYTANFNKIYVAEPETGDFVTIDLKGLAGGHSGAEIHKKRLNAVKVLAEICERMVAIGCTVSEFRSGTKMNAIPFGGFATLKVNSREDAERQITAFIENLDIMCISPDDKPVLDYRFTENITLNTLNSKDSKDLIRFLKEIPDGIVSYTDNTKSLVETSLNIGVAEYMDGKFCGVSLLRSSVNSDLDVLSDHVGAVAKRYGIEVSFCDRYPAWEFIKASKLRDKMCNVYKQMFGSELKIDVIHAGLECGILSDKLPGLDCVSIGPNILDIHTASERLDLKSAERTYKFILKVLEEI